MKKLILLSCILISHLALAQSVDKGPTEKAPRTTSKALFDLEFGYDIGLNGSVGDNDLTGVIFVNDQYWVSEFDTATIHLLSSEAELLESFTIPGISGTRSFTTDGTNLYLGTAQSDIFIVDPITRTMTGQITVTTTSTASARMVAFDPTLDEGNGGFWIGSFTSDIASVDMSGNELSVIPSADHGTVVYGGAVDFVTEGGPFLWIHDLSGEDPEQDFITQIDLATGMPTGIVFNFAEYSGDFGAEEINAGGLFITSDVTNGTTSLVGVCQCLPSNILFSLTLDGEILNTNSFDATNFTMFPNPNDTGVLRIKTSLNGAVDVSVFDVLGKKVINTTLTGDILNVSSLTSGIYIVQVTQDGVSAQKKLIIGG